MFHSMEIRKPARFVRMRRLEPGSRVSTRARQVSLPGEVRVRGLMHARGEFYPTPQEAEDYVRDRVRGARNRSDNP